MNILMKTFGENMLNLRKSLGLTQDEMAKLIGVSRVTINRVENGKQVMRPDTMDRLHAKTGVRPSVLFSQGSNPLEYTKRFEAAPAIPSNPGPSYYRDRLLIAVLGLDEKESKLLLDQIESRQASSREERQRAIEQQVEKSRHPLNKKVR